MASLMLMNKYEVANVFCQYPHLFDISHIAQLLHTIYDKFQYESNLNK